MKKIFTSIVLTSFMTFGVFSHNCYAEDATTNVQESVSQDVTEDITEDATNPDKWIILDGYEELGTWNGSGDFVGIVDLSFYDLDFGIFENIYSYESNIENSDYIVTQTGSESFTVTIKEEYLKTLSNGEYYFSANFSNGLMDPAFAINIFKKEIDTTENYSKVTEKADTTPITTEPKIDSPKTGNKKIGIVFTLLSLSGTMVLISKNKKVKFTKHK